MRVAKTLALCALLLSSGCAHRRPAAPPRADERLQATLWLQTAAEYRLISEATYRQACRALDEALDTPTSSAALEQTTPCDDRPPAVLLDVDDTVLDTSRFQGLLLTGRCSFGRTSWRTWTSRAVAPALPGALEFLAHARSRGVEALFLTNRDGVEEWATIRNLRKLGVPASADTVMCRLETGHDDWTADKTSRRAWAAARYRIVLAVGDDLNDFVHAKGLTVAQRDELVLRHRHRMGRQWFLLPNPLYGSWDVAVQGGTLAPTLTEARRRKWNAVRLPD